MFVKMGRIIINLDHVLRIEVINASVSREKFAIRVQYDSEFLFEELAGEQARQFLNALHMTVPECD